ncbi:MAG: T9SS type A sorting domain-containing protein, partial [Bacteroidota bacterium]
ANTNFNKIFDFNGINGQVPVSGDLLELDTSLISTVPYSIPYSSLIIAPNPTTSELTIKNKNLLINTLELYDLLGEKVFTRNYPANNNEITIDIRDLTSGIYIIQATSGEKTWRGKVVKE